MYWCRIKWRGKLVSCWWLACQSSQLVHMAASTFGGSSPSTQRLPRRHCLRRDRIRSACGIEARCYNTLMGACSVHSSPCMYNSYQCEQWTFITMHVQQLPMRTESDVSLDLLCWDVQLFFLLDSGINNVARSVPYIPYAWLCLFNAGSLVPAPSGPIYSFVMIQLPRSTSTWFYGPHCF